MILRFLCVEFNNICGLRTKPKLALRDSALQLSYASGAERLRMRDLARCVSLVVRLRATSGVLRSMISRS